MQEKRSLQSVADAELLQRLAELIGQSRRVEADIVAHIAEVEQRGLYAREAFPSMFVYCLKVLNLSEREAYLRISVARASREHPVLLTMLADGRLHLTAIALLAPHLTRENRDGLLERGVHKTKRQIEELIAVIAPRPDVPAMVRKLPEGRRQPTAGNAAVPNPSEAAGSGPDPTLLRPDVVGTPEPGEAGSIHAPAAAGPAPQVSATVFAHEVAPSVVQPLSPGRYKVQFTASAEFREKLERLRALMGRGASGGDLAAVIEQAITEKLERLEARRFARTKGPRKGTAESNTPPSSRHSPAGTHPDPSPSSRHIPAAIRCAVHKRDGGRCRYVDDQGRRCPAHDHLEYHHRQPFGLGGEHSMANLRLMCRAHNAYLAECDYGKEAMARHRRSRGQAPAAPAG
jgi:5-methylcytosine-specific restriction endonuclease McrA